MGRGWQRLETLIRKCFSCCELNTKNNSSGSLEDKSNKQFHIWHRPFDSGHLSSRVKWKKPLFSGNNPVSSVLLQHKPTRHHLPSFSVPVCGTKPEGYAYWLSLILSSPDVTPRPQLWKIFLGTFRHRAMMVCLQDRSTKTAIIQYGSHQPSPLSLQTAFLLPIYVPQGP